MSDEPDNPDEAPEKKRARSARAFTSLLLGVFGILLGGGAYLLHHWHTSPPAFMQLDQAGAQTATNAAPAQNANSALLRTGPSKKVQGARRAQSALER